MKELFRAIRQAQLGIDVNIVIYLSRKISRENILNFEGLRSVNSKTSTYFSTGGYIFDQSFDKEFDTLFLLSKPNEHIKIKSVVKNAWINNESKIDYFPAGLSGLILIDFPNGIPECVNMLSEFGSPDSKIKGDMIYLTTQTYMDKILQFL
jgi:hypothetical protein